MSHHWPRFLSVNFKWVTGKCTSSLIELIKTSIKKQQGVFTHYKRDHEFVTKLSFNVN